MSFHFEWFSSTEVRHGRHLTSSLFKDLQILWIDFAHSAIFCSLKIRLDTNKVVADGDLQSKLAKSAWKLLTHCPKIVNNTLTLFKISGFIFLGRTFINWEIFKQFELIYVWQQHWWHFFPSTTLSIWLQASSMALEATSIDWKSSG